MEMNFFFLPPFRCLLRHLHLTPSSTPIYTGFQPLQDLRDFPLTIRYPHPDDLPHPLIPSTPCYGRLLLLFSFGYLVFSFLHFFILTNRITPSSSCPFYRLLCLYIYSHVFYLTILHLRFRPPHPSACIFMICDPSVFNHSDDLCDLCSFHRSLST